ncbi:MAG: FtsW/RodA/SpoVE family cell cycle protein, partial [Bacteroidales bacterium]|nr:FtsW/RodA/SpoVE family cell cycle protein [Bacteroidales bacterium]
MILENSTQRGLGQSLDLKLIITYLLLVVIGWINIYASIHSSDPASIFDFEVRSGKQAVWIATAFILALTIIFVIPPRWWEGFSVWFYAGVVFLLVAVIFLGTEVKGSKSWFQFG